MKQLNTIRLALIGIIFLCLSSTAQADSGLGTHGKLRLGTRMVHRVLTDSDSGHKGGWYGSGTFLGTIYGLEEKQNYAPMYPYVSWLFNEYVGLELSFDQIKAETRAIDIRGGHEKTDGTCEFMGPVVTVQFRYPNATSFVPYGGVGLGFYSADFDHDRNWEYPTSGGHHVMDVDNTVALNLTVGSEWHFTKNWFLDLSLQYTKATMDAVFHNYNSSGQLALRDQPGEFPMDNIAIRLGIAYQF